MDSSSELQAENQALRQQLESLLREARSNEDKMRRFEQLEHRLIGARSMADLLRLLLNEYRQSFGIDCVTLALLDRDQETSGLLDAERPRDDQAERAQLDGLTLLHSLKPIESLFQDLTHPSLGPFNEGLHRPLFGTPSPALASVALLPLSRHGELIGSLHFGSTDPSRYERAAGTQLLQRLAAIVSVCLDNALNHERLKRAGLSDMLTGVHNRRYFEHRSQIEVSQARRYQHDLACLFLDLDHFKTVNDSFGHAAGDAVLQKIAHIIQAQLRAGDTVARFGGEEFVVLLPQAPAQHARDIAERIRLSISAEPLTLPGGEVVPISVSIGLAMLGLSHLSGDSPSLAQGLVNDADRALYRAKATGRNRVTCSAASDKLVETLGPQKNAH
ncbi:sensor domain-containing diguanylate cyclase [Paucibacter sp. TC2R-5]|uniref:GGDEF domain-containing protein n=1 Tax=Paucibacter sp. TC2R-5 TaxID=2893555 RepID=UPI0021E35EEE|nr:sensor domain-containing diguanylate cyclase [Paucibacter sp. TC2R-5]MCV2358826.1 sensor domain-containing diguanylate cyclase [Paucibacter sp. TC2R-5]